MKMEQLNVTFKSQKKEIEMLDNKVQVKHPLPQLLTDNIVDEHSGGVGEKSVAEKVRDYKEYLPKMKKKLDELKVAIREQSSTLEHLKLTR